MDNDFEKWWEQRKKKVPKGKRFTARRWAFLGWQAHISQIKKEEEEERKMMEEMVNEYHKAGCPQGWWGEFS